MVGSYADLVFPHIGLWFSCLNKPAIPVVFTNDGSDTDPVLTNRGRQF